MKRNLWLRQFPLALLVCSIVITATAWQGNPVDTQHTKNDTIPNKVRSIDDALMELERAKSELERTIKEKHWDAEIRASMKEIDAEKIKAQMETALKQVDIARIQAEVQRSMAQVDFDAIKKQIEQSINATNSEEVKKELEKALKAIDADKIKAEADASVAKVDMEKIRAEIEKIHDVEFEKLEEELKNIGPKIEESLKGARESIENAKKELLLYKEFLGSLEKDGLLNQKEPYEIQYKNNELTINGKKQPAEVLNRYKEFFKNRKDFTIRKNKNDFNIDLD